MAWFKKLALPALGIAIGGAMGWAYWYWVGCESGACPITSRPLNSSLYGAIMGVLLFSTFNKKQY
ncbi:MAG: hypothetical protein JSU09_08425 [Bacteroidetes bacterium]|nr:hypothetical protein [Bacteroidota bacterium]